MLFNSLIFIFLFLPVVWAGYQLIRRHMGLRAAFGFLILGSLFFYAYWRPVYLFLILGSVFFNYAAGRRVVRSDHKKKWLAMGVAGNLLLLGFFKYTDFVISIINDAGAAALPLQHIMLPLAISFFTFQQIAFLTDCYRGKTEEKKLLDYMLFVSFFPQLIAGPIVHHREIMPQFKAQGRDYVPAAMVAGGLTLFSIGLFKKAVLADTAAISANTVFGAAQAGEALSLFDAWGGAFAYSFQIYFDFSGYSDMAIGLGLLFGVILPMNFYAPYLAGGFIDFWRRWHITLSRFLRDNLYIPLGGNRNGHVRHGVNILITMLLGGLWHGAAWTFVVWGGLHGVFIVLNHMLRAFLKNITVPRLMTVPFTFLLVTVLWVFFRAESFDAALVMLSGMVDVSNTAPALMADKKSWALLVLMFAVTFTLPNSMKFTGLDKGGENIEELRGRSLVEYVPFVKNYAHWSPHVIHALLTAGLFLLALMFMQSNLGKEFIYFDF